MLFSFDMFFCLVKLLGFDYLILIELYLFCVIVKVVDKVVVDMCYVLVLCEVSYLVVLYILCEDVDMLLL